MPVSFLSLETFLGMFKTKKTITISDFLKHAQVRVGDKLILLREYRLKHDIDLEDIKLLFYHIQHKNEYLTRFYNTSLRVPETLKIDEIPMKNKHMNNNELVVYKNLIRNLFHLDILKNTQSGMENVPSFMNVILDFYTKNIIDYKILTPSALFYMKNGRLGSVFSSFYFRASIMNPYLVFSLNKTKFKGKRIFTPTLGWCSYFHGFAESGVVEYVGIDVIPSVCHTATEFAQQYYPHIKTHIVCSPSEKVFTDKKFTKKYKEHFDVVFFSPPYFKLEMYPGAEQSTEKYPDYKTWLEKYWEKTIQLCEWVLVPGGTMCYILSDYGSEKSREKYSLLDDMNTITRRYFELKEIQPMANKNVHSTDHRETAEKIMIFQKPA
jgi:hypothetical protein